ncbi:MAG TPA: AmmeMemoRadiSam system radical SAM enzyme [bacterium]|nr:AmmeMemoRadiSam system radical SAM enzyme [bacterium]HOL35348.1 AmmeMemoRadiSam system radical SAM enzyme [bacterium]HPP08525.1 AmmeMemoRadiSam system radical SAM enzyme [bacterium]
MNNKTLLVLFGLVLLCSVCISQEKLKEALFYEKSDQNSVQCRLCPKNCLIPEGRYGFCRARKNIGGVLYSMGYGKPCSVAIDPIEKKPLFHFLPGTKALSIASAGCSLRCLFCQNWEISQVSPEETRNINLSPDDVVKIAKEKNCPVIAYTYSEPVNFYEYMLDTAKIARSAGIKNIMHTAGYINQEPLEKLLPYIDAANVDLKGFSPEYYKNVCGANLEDVLRTLTIMKKHKVWIEITNLIVPGYNDSPDEIKKLCLWIKTNLGPDIPVHFTRFYPVYKLAHLTATPYKTLEDAYKIAKGTGLKYVYIGNVYNNPYENTVCPKCGKIVIKRKGFEVLENHIRKGKCQYCGTKISGIWE